MPIRHQAKHKQEEGTPLPVVSKTGGVVEQGQCDPKNIRRALLDTAKGSDPGSHPSRCDAKSGLSRDFLWVFTLLLLGGKGGGKSRAE